jgi:hypothetical protein
MASVPAEIHGQRYISLATFRKSGVPVYTPIWFAEDNSKLYFMTNSKLGKVKSSRPSARQSDKNTGSRVFPFSGAIPTPTSRSLRHEFN